MSSLWRHYVVPAYWLRTTSRSAIATPRTGTAVVSMNLNSCRPVIKYFPSYISVLKGCCNCRLAVCIVWPYNHSSLYLKRVPKYPDWTRRGNGTITDGSFSPVSRRRINGEWCIHRIGLKSRIVSVFRCVLPAPHPAKRFTLIQIKVFVFTMKSALLFPAIDALRSSHRTIFSHTPPPHARACLRGPGQWVRTEYYVVIQ